MMIKLDNISKYYYSSNSVVPALRKIRLEFDIGEFVAITGESGSGKSTLLNIISGLDTYDDGELYVNEEETSFYDALDWEEYRKNKIGFVFQNYNLIEHYSVLSNVESSLLIQGYSVKAAKSRAKELITIVGLHKQLHQRASKLSSGQKQRLSIARALAKNTDIIIADEPTGNLDSENGRQIMELLSKLSRDKLIITVTHNYEEAAPYVTRKIRLHDGEVVADTYVNRLTGAEDAGKSVNVQEENSEVHKEEQIDVEPLDQKVEKPEDQIVEKPDGKLDEKSEDDQSTADFDRKTGNVKLMKRKNVKSDARIAWRFTRMNIVTQPRRVLLFTLFLLMTAAVTFLFLAQIYANWDDVFTKDYENAYFANLNDRRIVVKKPDDSPITDEDIKKFNSVKYVDMADRYDYSNDINYFMTLNSDYEFIYHANDDPKSSKRLKEVKFLNYYKFMRSATCITEEDLSTGRLPESRNEIVIYSEDESILGTEQDCYFASRLIWGYNEYYLAKMKVVGILRKETSQVFFSEELCNILSLKMYQNYYELCASKNIFTNAYMTQIGFIPVINDDLKYGDLRVSADLASVNSTIAGNSEVNVYTGTNQINYITTILDNFHTASTSFVEMNKDMFYEIYQEKSNQASLYLKDYIYTDYVLKKLKSMGYEAINALRVSVSDYNYNNLMARNTAIYIALIVLLIISILEILIVRSIMKIRNQDFIVLGSIGMNHRTIKLMNLFEMYIYSTIAILAVIIAANVMSLFRVNFIGNMIKYFNAFTYSIYIILNLTTITITVWLFNRYLRRKQKWSRYD